MLKFPILDVHSWHTAVTWGKQNRSQVPGPGELLLTALPCLRHTGNPMLSSQAALHFGSLHPRPQRSGQLHLEQPRLSSWLQGSEEEKNLHYSVREDFLGGQTSAKSLTQCGEGKQKGGFVISYSGFAFALQFSLNKVVTENC